MGACFTIFQKQETMNSEKETVSSEKETKVDEKTESSAQNVSATSKFNFLSIFNVIIIFHSASRSAF